MGVEAIIKALPVTGIESQWLARLSGFLPEAATDCQEVEITFLGPPAGQHVPFIDPVKAMTILFNADGMTYEDASTRAITEFTALRTGLSVLDRPRLYDGTQARNIPECVSMPRFVAFLKSRSLASQKLIDFIEHACDETCTTKVFHARDYENDTWRLDELPDMPLPKTMIEFFVGTRSEIAWDIAPEGPVDGQLPPALLAWRESMMPVAKRLEQILGEEIFYFQDLDDDRDDDWCHRFFVLHCWCSLLPESDYVQYLLEVTGMPDVESLKTALLAPESFQLHPFKFECEFVGTEATVLQFRYER